jgi:hypothetical protein
VAAQVVGEPRPCVLWRDDDPACTSVGPLSIDKIEHHGIWQRSILRLVPNPQIPTEHTHKHARDKATEQPQRQQIKVSRQNDELRLKGPERERRNTKQETRNKKHETQKRRSISTSLSRKKKTQKQTAK